MTTDQTFSASYAKDSTFHDGLRSFFEYRDLGVAGALECSDDLELLEVTSPAKFETRKIEQAASAASV